MRYTGYSTKVNGLEKHLGVLGECHIYSPEESELAESLVPYFDTVGYEGGSKMPLFVKLSTPLFVPMLITLILRTDRKISNKSAEKIAEEKGKKIIRLEEGTEEKTWPLKQKLAFFSVGIISIPLSPFTYHYLKKNGDPYKAGTKAYKKRIEKDKMGKRNLYSKLVTYAYGNNNAVRSKIMSDRAIEILKKGADNLLVVCGEMHYDRVNQNFQEQLELKVIKKASINPLH